MSMGTRNLKAILNFESKELETTLEKAKLTKVKFKKLEPDKIQMCFYRLGRVMAVTDMILSDQLSSLTMQAIKEAIEEEQKPVES